MSTFDQSVCVSGTHGKTTTTSMIAQCFVEAGADPSVHIGGDLPAIGGGTLVGKGDTFIAEACEYNGSFWHFYPTVAVILNIDEDHLDFYKDIDDIEASFTRFASLVPPEGWCVGWGGDKRVREVLSGLKCHTRTYGLEPFNELRAEGISYDELGRASFTATLFGHPLMDVQLSVVGEANLLDALACIAVADICQLPMSSVAETLSRFTGAHRRFDLTSTTDGVRVYQDYAHNPAEIKNALHIAAMQPHKTLWAVWQPHTYSRTKKLFDSFMSCFREADRVLVTDICAAREADPGDINSAMLIEPLKEHGASAVLTPSFDDAENYLRAHWQPGDMVVTLGCGDIDLLNEQIAKHGDTKTESEFSLWRGFRREDFSFRGHKCTLVHPDHPKEGNPWVWRAEFFDAFAQVDEEMARRGYYVAYVSLSNRYGCPSAVEDMEIFRKMLAADYHLSEKALIFGFSRGALYAVNYALTYPSHTEKLYLDAPVLNIRSWPGGKGQGEGAPSCWAECLETYGLTEETAETFDRNPLDRTEELARLDIPVVLVAGGSDRTVPYCENGEPFAARFRRSGGKIMVIVKPDCDHHPHSVEDPTPVADFLEK